VEIVKELISQALARKRLGIMSLVKKKKNKTTKKKKQLRRGRKKKEQANLSLIKLIKKESWKKNRKILKKNKLKFKRREMMKK